MFCRFSVQNNLIAFLHIYFQFNFDGRFVLTQLSLASYTFPELQRQKKLCGLFIFIISCLSVSALILSLLQFNMCRKLICRLWVSASI